MPARPSQWCAALARPADVQIIEVWTRTQVVLELDNLALQVPVLDDVDHDGDLLAVPSHHLRALSMGRADELAEALLGVLHLPLHLHHLTTERASLRFLSRLSRLSRFRLRLSDGLGQLGWAAQRRRFLGRVAEPTLMRTQAVRRRWKIWSAEPASGGAERHESGGAVALATAMSHS
jgi:hypothetical protein